LAIDNYQLLNVELLLMDTALKIGLKPSKPISPSINQESLSDDSQAESLVAVEGLIRNRLQQIEVLTSEMSALKEMFDDYLVNDPKYSEASEAAKEATKGKTAAKKEAVSQPEAESIIAKLKDAREQLKDLKDTFSASLRDYERLAGTDQIEIEPGDIRKIVYKARLVKASSKFGR
jgi:hypothetical protein